MTGYTLKLQDDETQHFPDGNGWSKLHGQYTAKGMTLYWADGTTLRNTAKHCMFTGMHGNGYGGTVDWSTQRNA